MIRPQSLLLVGAALLAGCSAGPATGDDWSARGTYDARASQAAIADAKRADAARPRDTAMQLPTTTEPEQQSGANERLREAQAILKQNGLYDGPLDGFLTARTQAGIKAWQDQHQLAATGRLDPATYNSLKTAGL